MPKPAGSMTAPTAGSLASLFGMSEEELEKHSRLIFWEGVIFVIFGFFAIVLPALSSLVVTMVIGWLFLISGFLQFFRCWKSRKAMTGIVTGIMAIISVIAGLMLLFEPLEGIVALTLLLAIYFLVSGIFKLLLPLQMTGVPNRGWMAVDGLVTIGLAVIIFLDWPFSALQFLGILAGIYMLFGGNSLIFLSFGLKKAYDEHTKGGTQPDTSH